MVLLASRVGPGHGRQLSLLLAGPLCVSVSDSREEKEQDLPRLPPERRARRDGLKSALGGARLSLGEAGKESGISGYKEGGKRDDWLKKHL